MDITLVQTEFLTLSLPADGFELVNGERLHEITIAYEAYGILNEDRSNAILICHALTGDAHAAFRHTPDDRHPGWWDTLIGPGKGIDTDRFYIICPNILGGCKGTTGPSSVNPVTGRRYGTDFPLVSVRDTVRVERLFLEQLGIRELYGVAGGSLGGMRALEWAVAYPEFVRRCLCIASSANLTPQALAWDIIGREEIESDPNFRGGHYYDDDAQPHEGLSSARKIGHVTYLSAMSMERKFGRELQPGPATEGVSKFSTSFQVEFYLDHQGEAFIRRFDANSYLYISRMMDLYDLEAEHGDLRSALRQTQSRFLVVSITSDWLFPPSQQLEIVSALLAERKQVSYFQMDSPYGHDAFLLESEELSEGVFAFLNGTAPEPSEEPLNRRDFEVIRDMIPSDAHVLDVGSGDGSLMLALQRSKGVTGVCVDYQFAKVVRCMRKGLSALQLDADTSLGIISTDAFDVALLNQTIQQLHSALGTMKQILRIAPTGVVGFPNFAWHRHRASLFFRGKLPKSPSLPYEWYDTPNIHVVTVRDFIELCNRNAIRIVRLECSSDSRLGRAMLALGFRNLGAERGLVQIARAEGGST
ncbi:homoserine O-acetyltransferase [Candidatus Poribacteria bacterium]|nr:homoserine O-acetyltransferase [Candidatus Poribacteria bacterium]